MMALGAVWIYVLFQSRDHARAAIPVPLGVFMLVRAATGVTTHRDTDCGCVSARLCGYAWVAAGRCDGVVWNG
jgi:hypothetical protein